MACGVADLNRAATIANAPRAATAAPERYAWHVTYRHDRLSAYPSYAAGERNADEWERLATESFTE